MKRIFTLATLFVLVLTASAQGYRKWDFTNWSATTIANLQAGAAAGGVINGKWSDVEKKDGKNEAIYNLNGVRVKSISRGMNIIRDNKGVVRKVMVK